jgi:hypothetical protein
VLAFEEGTIPGGAEFGLKCFDEEPGVCAFHRVSRKEGPARWGGEVVDELDVDERLRKFGGFGGGGGWVDVRTAICDGWNLIIYSRCEIGADG